MYTMLSISSDVEGDWHTRTKAFRGITAQPHDDIALADSDNENIFDFTSLAKAFEPFEDDLVIFSQARAVEVDAGTAQLLHSSKILKSTLLSAETVLAGGSTSSGGR